MPNDSASTHDDSTSADRRIAAVALLVAVLVVPLAYLPSAASDMWPELFRRGVLGAIAITAASAIVLTGGLAALRCRPLAWPLAALVAVQALSAALSSSPAVAWIETLRIAVLAVVAMLTAIAPPWARRRAELALLFVIPIAVLAGTFENRNHAGAMAAASFVLAALLARSSRFALWRLPLGALALVSTRTRGAFHLADAVRLAPHDPALKRWQRRLAALP